MKRARNFPLPLATVRLLRAVQRVIRKSPSRYEQSDGGSHLSTCDTALCILGHAAFIRAAELTPRRRENFLREYYSRDFDKPNFLLTFGFSSCEQINRLFHAHYWPAPFTQESNCNVSVEIALKRINHFIKTDGRE